MRATVSTSAEPGVGHRQFDVRWVGVGVWAVAVLVLIGTIQRFAATDVTADTLFPLSVARDTASRGLALRGWALPPGPFLFPDVSVTYLLLRLGLSAQAAYLAYHVLTATVIAVATRSLTHRLVLAAGGSPFAADIATGVGLTAFLLASWFEGQAFVVSLMVLGAGFHGTGMIMGLVLAALLLRSQSSAPSTTRLVLVGLLVIATTSSQPLVASQGVLPVVVGLWLGRLPGWRRSAGVLAGSGVMGLVALANIHLLGFTTSRETLVSQASKPTDNLLAFVRDLPLMVKTYPAECLLAVIFIGLTTPLVVRGLRRQLSEPAAVDRAILGTLWAGVISALIVSATIRYSNLDHVRRFLPTLSYPALFLPAVLVRASLPSFESRRPRPVNATLGRLAALVMVLGVLASTTQVVSAGTRIDLPYQPHQQCLDEWRGEGRIHRGLGDYWAARFFTELSHNALVVAPVGIDGGLNVWMMNPDLFLAPDAVGYDFVIPDRLNEADLVARFGEPMERTTCARQPIWRYRPGVLDGALAEHRSKALELRGVHRRSSAVGLTTPPSWTPQSRSWS